MNPKRLSQRVASLDALLAWYAL